MCLQQHQQNMIRKGVINTTCKVSVMATRAILDIGFNKEMEGMLIDSSNSILLCVYSTNVYHQHMWLGKVT